MLQRRQHAHHNYNPGENPTTRLFDSNHSSEQMYGNGNTNYPHENYGGGDGNHGYYEHANRDSAITPKNSSLANMSSNIVSPHESPSDEGHGHAGGFERNQRLDMGGNRLSNPDQRREQFEHQQHSQQQHRQHQQQQHQQHSQNEHVMISGRPPMQGMKTRRVNYSQPQHHPPLQKPMPQPQPQQNQNQPDWHEINRQRMYQKQLASRQQQQRQNYGPHPPTNPSNQNAKLQSQMMPNSQPPLNNNSAYSQRRQHPSYFSPVEALDKRTDQIQRKKKLFVPGPGPQEMRSGNATSQFRDQNHVQPPPNNSHGDIGEGEESVASVSDRVRSFDNNATSARGPQQNGREESRSRSLSRGSRPLQLQSNNSKERRNSNPQYSRNLHPPVRVTAPQNEFNRNRDVSSGHDPARQLIGQSPWRHSNQPTSQGPQKEIAPQYPSLLDEDTVVGSVASLKKEWEVRATSGQNQNQSHTMPAPADNDGPHAFGGWGERANRLTQLRRQDQRRNTVDERSRRNVGRSLPPESRSHRHGGDQGGRFVNPDGERHHDGYQSDGPSCRQQGQNNVADERDSEPMSVKDVRSRLWDQNERLRAVLPTAASFESIGDVRKRWPDNSNSPGNMSGSTGSSLFKSKFVHAAAMAARQRANLDDVGKQKRELSSKQHNQKGVAASSHYTDSTAETTAITTPLGSYSSSYRVHSTVPRMADHSNGYHQRYPRQTNDHKFAAPSTYPVQVLEENGDSKERIEDEVDFDTPSRSQKTSTMPPIAEANNSLVSDLIAKLNAVSRANPADALAAIDSILQAEGGRAAFPKPIPISAPKKNLAPARPVAADRPSKAMRRPLGKDCFQEQSNDVFHDMPEHNDDPDDESCVSSDDSTVSSMTNPTYLSMTETAKRHLSKGGVSNSQKISPHAQSNFAQKRSFAKERQPQPTESEYYDNNNSSSINNTKKQPTAKEISPAIAYRNTPSHTGSHASRLESVEDDRKSNVDESAWESIPQNKYFSSAKGKSHAQSKERDTHQGSAQDRSSANEGGRISTTLNKTNDSQRHQEHPGETRFRKLKTAPQQNQSKPNPRLTSFPETEDDRLSALPHVVSDAFSNVDISLDDANPISSSVPTQSYSIDEPQSSLQTISQAFSDVNISLEHDKTVSQRRQELEYLSKSWTDKTSSDSTDRASNANADERLEIAPSWLTNNDKKYGNQAAQTSKLKKTMEPKLRLKGSKKLTQKFASLIKAFEDDEY